MERSPIVRLILIGILILVAIAVVNAVVRHLLPIVIVAGIIWLIYNLAVRRRTY